jgi:hypothetical protein
MLLLLRWGPLATALLLLPRELQLRLQRLPLVGAACLAALGGACWGLHRRCIIHRKIFHLTHHSSTTSASSRPRRC